MGYTSLLVIVIDVLLPFLNTRPRFMLVAINSLYSIEAEHQTGAVIF